jgi:hypothetical protein
MIVASSPQAERQPGGLAVATSRPELTRADFTIIEGRQPSLLPDRFAGPSANAFACRFVQRSVVAMTVVPCPAAEMITFRMPFIPPRPP